MLVLKRKLNQALVIAECFLISIAEIKEDQVCLAISVDERISIEQYRAALVQVFRTEEGHFDSCETLPEPRKVTVPFHHPLNLTEHVSIVALESKEDYVKCGVQAFDDHLIQRKEVWDVVRRDR